MSLAGVLPQLLATNLSSLEFMRLSVIIVSYNVRDLLRRCLKSVDDSARLTADWLTVDVTVVDNASRDGSAQMVAAEFPLAHLVASPQNLGFPRANNLALRRLGFGADGEKRPAPTSDNGEDGSAPDFVLLLNPDTEVVDDALGKMAAFLRDHTHAGACGPRLHYGDGSLQQAAFAYPGLVQMALDLYPLAALPVVRRFLHRLLESRLNGRYPRRQWLGAMPFPVGFVLGAALMVRAESILSTGLLDEGYFMYCEEMDWCLRMQTAGLPIFAVPTAQIVHHEGRSSRQVRWQSFERLWASRFRFFRLHSRLYPPRFHTCLRLLVRVGLACNALIARRRFAQGRLSGDRLAEQLDAYQKVISFSG